MGIYLDYNATTPIDKEVAEFMKPFLNDYFGNPSSSHSFGVNAKKAVENARAKIANLLGCKASEIVFTSGGSEANNYAIKGYAFANENRGKHIITSQIEHPAVIEVCKFLETKGFEISYIPVDEFGIIDLKKLESEIRSDTILISVMHANNEIGSIQPLKEISKIAKKYNIVFHTDAAQSVGKIPTKVNELGVDMLSLAGHKLYAPKGIGVLYIKEGIFLEKLIHGAEHEQNKRAGTENVLEIAGLGKACEIAERDMEKNIAHSLKMRDLFHTLLSEKIESIKLNGHRELRLPNTLNISFKNIEANILLNEMETHGIAASAGAACHAEAVKVSTVLQAINVESDYAMGTIRFSVGRQTTENEIREAAKIIIEIVENLKSNTDKSVEPTENPKIFKLTKYTQGLGCACKLSPQDLEKVLKDLPSVFDKNVLIDASNSDDAAVYKIDENTALVQTLDFFTPVVDDAYDFGAIAAANALSDIYAMGAKPIFALNIVGFPANRLDISVLNEILRGAADKAKEAGISILGGHTIHDVEPKFGMAVSGLANPNKIKTNAGAKHGDAIILTKKIGTGILTTAIKKDLISEKSKHEVIASMKELNMQSAEIISKYEVNACTDITGFGLAGHLSELLLASKLSAEIFENEIPYFEQTEELAYAGVVPGGSLNNLQHFSKNIIWKIQISETRKLMFCDAQTSGGLLFTVPNNLKDKVIEDLYKNGITTAKYIGNCYKDGESKIIVK
ncbi:MAG TPA: selenide, water dikinase SelD [Bacteroidales bacterium]|nr:selenide, water dikinase SelD [Bacteroidales bacterium]HPL05204.1 selenide, water dikinase SelD [Bacteroidales bacterium]